MRRNVRPLDRVYRIGGEEFVAILPSASVDQARGVADRLRRAVAVTPFPVDDGTIDVSVSIGVATTDEACEQDALMERADAALYEAKKAGRNRVVASDRN